MKKLFLLVVCVGILTGCSRYSPIEMSPEPEAAQNEEGHASLEQGDGVAAAGAQMSGETDQLSSASDKEENGGNLIRITDEEESALQDRKPIKVKGIYISAYVAGSRELMDKVISHLDDTELNAIVIDFKDDDGRITTPVNSAAFNEIGSCKPYVADMKALIQELKAHGVYVIARVVTFKDPYLAEQKPEWSLKTADGSLYRDKKGLAWVNPYKREVWDYLVEVGTQAAALGFDEIQFDYIRFATDSTMKNVVFDDADTLGRSKTDIITEFTQYAYDRLAPLGLFVSADVFGAIIGSDQDAEAVGQIYAEMAGNLDYICPMIYPSHYGDGNFGLDHPDLHPYETILAALHKSKEELALHPDPDGKQAVVRPWLQDFTASYLKHHIKYGDEEIREQIRAVKDAGYDEWILWCATNKYHYGALEKAAE